MAQLPGCFIWTRQDPANTYGVQSRHYEALRNALDTRERGWIELDSIHADGKIMLRLEDITAMMLATEDYAAAVNALAVTSDT